MPELRPLSEPLAKKAALELNETPENAAHKLIVLREWAKAQSHLRSRLEDQFLISFLRCAKFNLERAKQKLEDFYVYKMKMPELFYGRDPCDPKVYTVLKLGCLNYLPQPITPDGPRVAMIRPTRFDLTQHTVIDVFVVGAMLSEMLLTEDDHAIVAGYVLCLDIRDIPTELYFSVNPDFVRKIVYLANKISPGRMKGFHIIHSSNFFTKFFNAVKSVINEKLRDRIYMHCGSLETFYEHIPRKILTKDFGGEVDDSGWADYWWKRVQDKADYIRAEETYGCIGKMKTVEEYRKQLYDSQFGVEGSFRKLCID